MPEPTAKAELRRRFKAQRDAAAGDRAAWSLRVCAHIAAFCAGRGIRRVGSFGPFGSEVDLSPLEQMPLELFFPRVVGQDPPRLAWGPGPLAPGTWGLQEPAAAPHPLPPVQLLLVPGLAFAADGHRLGYGKGFYDAVLAGLPADVIVLGAGFGLQCCDRLPASPQDRPVQGVVTEEGISWVRPEDQRAARRP
jgi:5-formyltetrahydrofolate cyclo-ligase